MTRQAPIRTCIGCRTRRPQQELLRVVRRDDGTIVLDTGRRRAPGRGAYVCRDVCCLEAIQKRHGLRRALRGEVAASAYDDLRRCLDAETPSSEG